MSLTMKQLLTDARKLSSRLRECESTADLVISQSQATLKSVEAMKEYDDEMEYLSEETRQRPRAVLVQGIQQENRHIRELQQENRELRAALEEHRNALDLIMSKYRQHIIKLIQANKLDAKQLRIPVQDSTNMLMEKNEKICEMASVMHKAIMMDEEAAAREQELLTRLVTENKGLRELLQISCKNGSVSHPIVSPTKDDKEIQTDMEVPENTPRSPSTDNASSSASCHDAVAIMNSSSEVKLVNDAAVSADILSSACGMDMKIESKLNENASS